MEEPSNGKAPWLTVIWNDHRVFLSGEYVNSLLEM